MSDLYTINNNYKIFNSRHKAIKYSEKIESFFAAVITILATIGIFRSLLQAVL